MLALSRTKCFVLASAYELQQPQVEEDALSIQQWGESEAGLLNYLQKRHGWTTASGYAPYYVADLRQALQPFSSNGANRGVE